MLFLLTEDEIVLIDNIAIYDMLKELGMQSSLIKKISTALPVRRKVFYFADIIIIL
jgi:hypothetical protein